MKTERFEMRAGEDFFDAIDNWRRAQPDLPPRAEAVRRLVEAGLKSDLKPMVDDARRLLDSLDSARRADHAGTDPVVTKAFLEKFIASVEGMGT
jgi:hypothetical protein